MVSGNEERRNEANAAIRRRVIRSGAVLAVKKRLSADFAD
jgi:hypothetical protein